MIFSELYDDKIASLRRWVQYLCIAAIVYQTMKLVAVVYYTVRFEDIDQLSKSEYLLIRSVTSMTYDVINFGFIVATVYALTKFNRGIKDNSSESVMREITWLKLSFKYSFINIIIGFLYNGLVFLLPYFF